MTDKEFLLKLPKMSDAIAVALLAVPFDLGALTDPAVPKDRVLAAAQAVEPNLDLATVDAWVAGAVEIKHQLEELENLPIVGRRKAEALFEKGITLFNLPTAKLADVAAALGAPNDLRTAKMVQTAALEETLDKWIYVRDMKRAHDNAYAALKERLYLLDLKLQEDKLLPPMLNQERIALTVFTKRQGESKMVIDPLFKAVQEYQVQSDQNAPEHDEGSFTIGGPAGTRKKDVLTLIAMYGIMRRENQVQPIAEERTPNALAIACHLLETDDFELSDLQKKVKRELENYPDPVSGKPFDASLCGEMGKRTTSRHFGEKLTQAKAEYIHNKALYEGTFDVVRGENLDFAISAEKWASVTGILQSMRVSDDDKNLPLLTKQVLAGELGVGDGLFPSGISIDLPDLEAQTDVEIIQDNLYAMQAIYFSAMLDEANVFQVRDALMSSFQYGLLPFGRGRAGDLIYRMIREAPNRLSEYDRRNLYARTLGFPGGDAHGTTNRDFQTLWLRFVSAVSSFARQLSLDYLLRAQIPARVRQEQVKKTGRDLAANLSLHGFGISYFAATELQEQIDELLDLLGNHEVRSAYGARDMWGVVEQVSALELGGARDTIRYRTMASAGAIIIRWLANHRSELAEVGAGAILDVSEINRPTRRPPGTKATVDPYDSDLVDACERWLAVTGTPDQQVESYAAPTEGPVQTSQPVRIPSIARDMLESVGIDGFGS